MGDIYTWLILSLAAAWVLQLYLSTRQLRSFYARFNELRKAGRCAIGMDGSVYRRRVYVVLVADDDDRVIHAEQLSGWTVFARLRPTESIKGCSLSEIVNGQISGVSPKIERAFRQAAADILAAGGKEEATASKMERG